MACYILRCGDGTLYVGSARNLDNRLEQHYSGNGGAYTSKRMPVELVWFEEHTRIDEAYERETQLQEWSRAKREALIRGDLAALRPLSRKDFSKRKSAGGGLDTPALPAPRPAGSNDGSLDTPAPPATRPAEG